MSARGLLDEVDLLVVDGNNLLHRTAGGVQPGALRTLLARLQAGVRAPVQTILVLDGHPAPGTPARQRVSGSLELRHAGSVNADDAIVQLLTARPYAARARTLVVSDDRALVERSRTAGGRTQRLEWLQSLLERPQPPPGATIGRRARTPHESADESTQADAQPWTPGRRATRKTGNPRRAPRPRRG